MFVYKRGFHNMNNNLNTLLKVSPILAVIFILFGVVMAILGIIDQKINLVLTSIFLILQSIIILLITRYFAQLWQKR